MLGSAYGYQAVNGIPFPLAVKLGMVEGFTGINFFGRSADIDTADGFKAIWNGPGAYSGHDATQEEIITIQSDNALDAGISIIVFGLDINFKEISEVVVLDGGGGAVSTLKYLRLQRALVVSPNTVNAGSITIRQSLTTANVFAIIAKKNSAVCEVRAKVRTLGGSFQIAEWFSIDSKASSYVKRVFEVPLDPVFTGGDLIIEANTDTNSIKVAAGLALYLVDT